MKGYRGQQKARMLDLRRFREAVCSTQIAKYLGCEHCGKSVDLQSVSSLNDAAPGSLFFMSNYDPESMVKDAVCIVPVEARDQIIPGFTYILSKSPKLDFAKVIQGFLTNNDVEEDGASGRAIVHSKAKLGENVRLGSGSVIEEGAQIGDGTYIGANVVIKRGVTIGKNCVISDGAIIGNDGLTIVRDQNGVPIPMRHIGGLHIGNSVEIGPNSTIGRATLGMAIIGDHVKIGPQVNVGHNGCIEKDVIITGCASIAGGVIIGEKSWLGTNCSIKQKIRIGKECVIGMGACVVRDIPDGQVYSAFPAMPIRQLQQLRRKVL